MQCPPIHQTCASIGLRPRSLECEANGYSLLYSIIVGMYPHVCMEAAGIWEWDPLILAKLNKLKYTTYSNYLRKLKRISSSERQSRRIYQPSVTHEKDRGFLRHGRERHANGHRGGWQVRTESPTRRNTTCITFVIELLLLYSAVRMYIYNYPFIQR